MPCRGLQRFSDTYGLMFGTAPTHVGSTKEEQMKNHFNIKWVFFLTALFLVGSRDGVGGYWKLGTWQCSEGAVEPPSYRLNGATLFTVRECVIYL